MSYPVPLGAFRSPPEQSAEIVDGQARIRVHIGWDGMIVFQLYADAYSTLGNLLEADQESRTMSISFLPRSNAVRRLNDDALKPSVLP